MPLGPFIDWTRLKKIWGTRFVKLLLAFIPAFWAWLYGPEIWEWARRRGPVLMITVLLILAGIALIYAGTR